MGYQHQYIDGTPIHSPLDKLVCVGCNYVEHAEGLNNSVPTESLLFIKPGSCMAPVNGRPSLPQERGSVYYETRTAVLIDKPLSCRPNRKRVLDTIPGCTPTLDLTLREVQAKLKEKGLPWELAKNFGGADVLSPLVNAGQFPGPTDTGIRLTINGEMRQDGNSRGMLNPIVPLIRYIAGHFSLQAGDVTLTGTSSGVGPPNNDDELLLELPDISRFETYVFRIAVTVGDDRPF